MHKTEQGLLPSDYIKSFSKSINKCRKNFKISEMIPKNFIMHCKKLSLDQYVNEKICESGNKENNTSPIVPEKNFHEKGKAIGFLDLLEDVQLDQSHPCSSQEELNFQQFNKSKNYVSQVKKSTVKKPNLKKRISLFVKHTKISKPEKQFKVSPRREDRTFSLEATFSFSDNTSEELSFEEICPYLEVQEKKVNLLSKMGKRTKFVRSDLSSENLNNQVSKIIDQKSNY